MTSYYLYSLGCPKNLVDSERFAYLMQKAGLSKTDAPENADMLLVNTCGFIAEAKEEAINTILEAAQEKKAEARLVVTGCLVARYKEELRQEIPEVDLWLDLKDFQSLAELLHCESESNRELLTPPHYAYLRIADGCDNNCSYCAIPQIRGAKISVPQAELVREAKKLAQQGVQELIIIAQDTATWGQDLGLENGLPALLRELHAIDGFRWLRLMYLHPAHLTKELIITIKELPKVCRYFEIPIQHADDEILQSMNRHVTQKVITEKINLIRELMPESVIRTSIITGFPGETPKEFKALKGYLQQVKFERLGVFAYSPEEGTISLRLPKRVGRKTAEKRRDELMVMQQAISEEVLQKYLGKTIEVIVEERAEDEEYNFIGRSSYDAPEIDGVVYLQGKAEIGNFVMVEITDTWEYDLVGKIKKIIDRKTSI